MRTAVLSLLFATVFAEETLTLAAATSQETFIFSPERMDQITEMNAILAANQLNTEEIMRILDYFHFATLKLI